MSHKRRIALALAVAGAAAAPAVAATVSPVAGLYEGHTQEEHHRGVSFMLTDGRMHGFSFAGAPEFPAATIQNNGFRAVSGNGSYHLVGRWVSNTKVQGSINHYRGRHLLGSIAFSAHIPRHPG
jgi:hypothetical protein